MRILLVDDDENLMESLAERLIQQRYAVDIAVDGSSAETYVDLFDYDLIVLDLMLPDGDGIEFCRMFRQDGYANPLMILTAKESTAQKVTALDAGADDYVIKPFDFDELCARIRALLRREHQGLPTVLSLGPLRLDPSACETTYDDNLVRLTPKEFSMMELFLRHPHRVYSLGAIIDDLWSFEDPPGEDAVRTHIKGLRRKLKAAGAPKDLIKTVYGLGYRLNENTAGSAKSSQPSQKQLVQPLAPPADIQDKTSPHEFSHQEAAAQQVAHSHQVRLSEQLVQACRRYLGTASHQVATLEKVVAALSSDVCAADGSSPVSLPLTLPLTLYEEGLVSAHKLAGSLGSFGIAEGSQIARKIEVHLEEEIPQTASLGLKGTRLKDASEDTNEDCLLNVNREAITQLSEWVGALRSRVDQATVEAATDALTASVRDGLPVVLIVSGDAKLAQSLIQCASQIDLQTQVVATPQQAISILDLAVCDLILIDMPVNLTDDLQAFVQQVKQRYALPTVVLGAQLTLDQRLDLVRQGIKIVTQRSAAPLQIMTAAAGVIRAQVSKIRIAIADDDPDILALLKTSLEPWGFQITTFERAAHLWEWLANEPAPTDLASPPVRPKVDILVLDLKMPEMSGLDLCQILRADARFQSIPILFLTHYQEENLRLQAYQLGADDFIHKAVAPAELATRLRNQLTRASLISVGSAAAPESVLSPEPVLLPEPSASSASASTDQIS